ncbi:Uu.00g121080.m01.CDS01 [Anthostomella pinea]|uniref:Uu.00g121080.m01.CDS01 n=1 Tax=Anthostomella pinea TaxID=933095 RepID=A0AAI8VGV2_9PEZI|nr:Uu.00g121080.m01.CDS01 [Anthostomella pinea]
MDGLTEKTCKTSRGLNYRYYVSASEGKDVSKPPLMLLHGFPDSSLLWTEMLPHLSKLPNRLLIPDLLGYGGTDKPTDPKLYGYDVMAHDLRDIIDAEGMRQVVSLGHDWGSAMAQRFYNFHADRTAALGMLNVAYMPPDKEHPYNIESINAMTRKAFGYPAFDYQYLLVSPDAPELLEKDLDRTWSALHSAGDGMRELFCTPGALREYLSNHDIPALQVRDYAKDAQLKQAWQTMIRSGGFAAPCSWYLANTEQVNFEAEKKVSDANIKVDVPALFVGGAEDPVCRPEVINRSKESGLLPDLKIETVESGHFSPYDKPAEIAGHIKAFVEQKGL